MEHVPGNVTPTIIHTPATSSAESDPEPGPKDHDKPKDMPASNEKTSSQSDPLTRQKLSSVAKSLSIETSTPSSSRNSSPVIEDASSSSLQDKEILSDGPTSCSTPVSNDSEDMVSAHRGLDTSSSNTPARPFELDLEGSLASQITMGSTQTFHSAISFAEPEIHVPIVGYEIMEQRAKFTVFRIHVQFSETDTWFIFRRYTDFVRLNDRLRVLYPSFRLSLPPKRWFGSNFDPNFLEDRQLGLQAFLNNITGHKDIVQSDPVREFFCLDDPPGAHDSLEESRALCESLEETVYNLRKDLADRDIQLAQTKLQLAEARQRIAALVSQAEKAGVQLSSTDINSSPSMESDSSAVDFQSRIEADQAVRPMDQHRQEHRTKDTTSNIITLSSERNVFSSPNCNINNSTEYSLNGIAALHNASRTCIESPSEESDHSPDSRDPKTPAPAPGGIISVT